jgi:hypothetical protein
LYSMGLSPGNLSATASLKFHAGIADNFNIYMERFRLVGQISANANGAGSNGASNSTANYLKIDLVTVNAANANVIATLSTQGLEKTAGNNIIMDAGINYSLPLTNDHNSTGIRGFSVNVTRVGGATTIVAPTLTLGYRLVYK